MALPLSLSVLTEIRVLPAMTSLRSLLTSDLVKSRTRRLPKSGMMCPPVDPRPVSVTIVLCFFGRPPFPMMRPAFMSFR